jgi:hypothetical protein
MSVAKSFKPSLPVTFSVSTYLIMSVGILAFGLFMSVIGSRQIGESIQLQTSGVVVDGFVSDLKSYTDEGDTSYKVTYQFKALTDQSVFQSFGNRQSVTKKIFESLEIGGTVSIIYAESEPQNSSIVGAERSLFLPLSFFLALGLGAAWMLAKTVLKLTVAYELSTKGVLAEGEVEDLWIQRGGGDRHYISYSFGQGFSGREQLKKHIYRSIKTEDSIKIRYLDRDPQIFRLEIE